MPKDAEAKAKAAESIWENLHTYSMRWDRTAPAAFAGRDAEIATLTDSLKIVASQESPAGMTTIIQGVPGAGKTALGREFVRRTQGAVVDADDPGNPDKKKKRVTVCVHASTAQLAASPKSLVQHIHKEIMSVRSQFTKGKEKFKGQFRAHTEKVGDTAALLLKLKTGAEAIAAQNSLNAASPMTQCLDSYAEVWGDDLVIVLIVDEMQGCPINANSRDTLETLHQNLHKCRILPVLLGLSDTEGHVTDRDPKKGLGLSRLGLRAVKTIGCLNPAQGNEPSESRQAITGTLEALGLDWAEPGWRDILLDSGCDENEWTQWCAALVEQLEEDSADFPQHITAGLIATCETLYENRRRLTLNQDLRNVIAAQQQAHKDHYYQNRLAGDTEPYTVAFGALCELEAAGCAVTDAEVLTALEICAETPRARLRGAELPEVVQQFLSKGILQEGDNDTYACGAIPSLSNHLRNQYQQKVELGDPTAETLRETLGLDGGWAGGGGGGPK